MEFCCIIMIICFYLTLRRFYLEFFTKILYLCSRIAAKNMNNRPIIPHTIKLK